MLRITGAAFMGYTSTVEWLLSIGANRHEIAMELAAAAGRSDIVNLLLQVTKLQGDWHTQ